MQGYVGAIEKATQENTFFRKVLFTAQHCQLVVMSLLPNEEIGMEVHSVDQFFRFESGEGQVIMDGQTTSVRDGDAVIIPAGTQHNVINTSSSAPLKLYTIYSPPQHPDGTVHQTKAEAVASEKEE